MLFLFVIISLGVIAALWWWLDVPLPGAETLVVIKNGQVSLKRGHLRPPVLADVRAMLGEAGVSKGFAAVTGRRVKFSRSIPQSYHQRLRNVLLNT